jgi:hypothetical protein
VLGKVEVGGREEIVYMPMRERKRERERDRRNPHRRPMPPSFTPS